eukprot:6172476-Pleurochrysis_carterae.AAC.2
MSWAQIILRTCLVGSSGNFSIKSAYTCESWKPRQPAPNPKPRERRPVAVQAKTAGNTGEGVSSSDSSFDMIAEDWRRGQQSSSSQRQGPHNSQDSAGSTTALSISANSSPAAAWVWQSERGRVRVRERVRVCVRKARPRQPSPAGCFMNPKASLLLMMRALRARFHNDYILCKC